MPNQRALLQLTKLYCLDETTGTKTEERLGHDEMWLSGYGVDAAGQVSKLDPFEIDSSMDDGDVKEFSPPRTIFSLDVPEAGAFPKKCEVGFILAEKYDGAGQRTATDKAFADAKGAAQRAKADGGIVSAIVIASVSSYIKGLIADRTHDRVLDPLQASVEITSGDFRWPDGTKLSPETTLNFRGHESSYYLTYYWEVQNV